MILKTKRFHDNAIIPKYETIGAAAFDLVITEVIADEVKAYVEYKFGLGFEIPVGYVGIIAPRSSISNTQQFLANSIGVIDSDYRGEVSARVYTIGRYTSYKVGDRGMQMMILPVEHVTFQEVGDLSETDRGAGGYGSTGS